MARNVKRAHTTMRGKTIDMDLLQKRNELTPAIGNMRVNARGDELGAGGKIVRKREDIIKEYYEKNPNSVKNEESADYSPQKEEAKTISTTNSKPKTSTQTRSRNSKKNEDVAISDNDTDSNFEWEEDSDGNFVKKGSK